MGQYPFSPGNCIPLNFDHAELSVPDLSGERLYAADPEEVGPARVHISHRGVRRALLRSEEGYSCLKPERGEAGVDSERRAVSFFRSAKSSLE